MTEFADLVAVIEHCADENEPLPLHVAMAFADGRLEEMWANSREPNAMGMLLRLTYAVLPAELAVEVAEHAAQKIAKPAESWAEDRIDNILRELNYHVRGISDDAIAEIERDAERHGAVKGLSNRQQYAWRAIYTAIIAVRHQTEALEPGEQRDTTGITSRVLDTIYHAHAASVPGQWLADLLRPFGPPPLERIIARLER